MPPCVEKVCNLCSMPPCRISFQIFKEMQAAGFEFIPDQPQPEHPTTESVFFVVRLRPAGGGFFLHQRLMGDRQAELDVGFYLSGM